MITTYDPDVVRYWTERDSKPCSALDFDGICYWQIDVPEGDARLRDPEYVQLLLRGKFLLYPAILRKRLELPLYTITQGGLWAETRIGDDNEIRAVPLSRDKRLLQFAYGDPCNTESLSRERLVETLEQALEEKIEHIGLVLGKGHIEKIEICSAVVALRTKPDPDREVTLELESPGSTDPRMQ